MYICICVLFNCYVIFILILRTYDYLYISYLFFIHYNLHVAMACFACNPKAACHKPRIQFRIVAEFNDQAGADVHVW